MLSEPSSSTSGRTGPLVEGQLVQQEQTERGPRHAASDQRHQGATPEALGGGR